ncbi:zinc finger protein 385B-like [Mytilus edulis]|uniref:zinc finger protein 385B-like n=1 Tax=Mytilus edulis TaxID=6550 RepID=UPI0039EF8595
MPGFQCLPCNVNLNSQEQLAQHRAGAKHLKKLKEKGIGLAPEYYLQNTKIDIASVMVFIRLMVECWKIDLSNKPLFPPPPPPPPVHLMAQSAPKQPQPAAQGGSPASNIKPQARPLPPHLMPMGAPPQPPSNLCAPLQPPSHLCAPIRGKRFSEPLDNGQTGAIDQQTVNSLLGITPVMKAVVNNALGNLPLKRKLHISRCDACDIEFNAESQERQHYDGKKHAKRMRTLALEIKPGGEVSPSVLQASGFTCQFCDVLLNSLEQLEQHRFGSKHQKKVAAAKTITPGGTQTGTEDTSPQENDLTV